MPTGRQLNCFRGSGCLNQIDASRCRGFPSAHCYSGPVDGVIVVDKPEGLTSHDVVNRMRRLANTRKVGHLGTLDPMATGVLPLVLERATRLAQFLSNAEKTYRASVQFGWATDTYDREGTPISEPVDSAFHARGTGSSARALSRNHSANAAAVFGEKNCRDAGLSSGAKKHRRGIGTGRGAACSRWISGNLTEPPLAFRSAVRRELIFAASRTMLAASLAAGLSYASLRRTASGEFTESQARTLEALEELARAGCLRPGTDPRRYGFARDSQRHRRCAHRWPNPARQGFPVVAVRGESRVEIRKGHQSRG